MSPEIDAAAVVAASPFETLAGRPLTLLLHGYGAHERDLLPLAAALPGADVVLGLRGPVRAGPGFGWVDGPPEAVLAGTGLDAAADAVLRWLDRLVAERGRPDAIRLLGFSQGGALALTLLRRAPGRFARTAVVAGFVPVGAEAGDAVLAAGPPAVLWVRGDADPVIPREAVERTAAWLPAHAATTTVVVPGLGHGIDDRALTAIARFLAPHPDEVRARG